MKIKTLFNYKRGHESTTPMLSNANYDFWLPYINNQQQMDNMFARTYANFEYFNPLLDGDESEHDVLQSFRTDIGNYLFLHRKRFEEMFRIQGLDDADLPMTYNYDMTEIMDKDVTNQNTTNYGARSDSNQENNSTTLGARLDTTSENDASISGQRTDIDNLQVGNQKQSDVNKVTAFNSNNENTNTTNANEIGSRNDVREFTEGQQTTTLQSQNNFNKGAETDTSTNTSTFSKGAETDNSNGSESENYVLTRKGNIGVQTGADILMGFDKAMPVFDFYSKIFAEICENFLLIGGD